MDSDKLYSIIRSCGLDAQSEINVVEDRECSLKIEKGAFKGADIIDSKTVTIRSIYNGRSSSVSASIVSYDEIKNLLEKAYKLAKNGSSDTQSRFSWKRHKKIKESFSRKILDVDVNDIKTKLLDSSKKVASFDKVHSVSAWLEYSDSKLSAANSSGIKGDWRSSYSAAYSNIVAKEGDEQASDSQYDEALDPYGLHLDKIFEKCAKLAVNMLNAQRAPTFKGSVLISPKTASYLIKAFAGAMGGEGILKKTSFLTGMLHKNVASKLIKLSENPYVKGSPFNRSFDDEIMPTLGKDLIKDGVLKTYLHNIYSAEKMHQKPTGNGFEGVGSFIGTTNLLLKRGQSSTEKLLSKIKQGVYLLDTGDRPNMATGDLSAMVSEGYYIESGEEKYPLKETMIGINMIDLMKNVIAVGSEVRSIEGVFSPPILVEGVQISGK